MTRLFGSQVQGHPTSAVYEASRTSLPKLKPMKCCLLWCELVFPKKSMFSYVPCLSTLAGMCLSGVVCSTQGSGMLTGEYWAAELAGMAGLWCGVAVLDCW